MTPTIKPSPSRPNTDRPPAALFKNSLRAWQARWKAQREHAAPENDKTRTPEAPA
jgi:hypothetical protein